MRPPIIHLLPLSGVATAEMFPINLGHEGFEKAVVVIDSNPQR